MSAAAAQALETLAASILFEPGFPKRVSYSHRQYLAIRAARSEDLLYAAGIAAIEQARDQVGALSDCVELLGAARHEPAVPLLAQLWQDCALQPVWVAVGHALFEIGTGESLSSLLTLLEDPDYFAHHMAIKAVFARGSGPAYEYFDAHWCIADGCHWLLPQLFDFLGRGGLDSAPRDNQSDSRWLTACAWHRRHATIGAAAREVLRQAEPAARAAAIAAARAGEAPPPPPRTARAGDLLRRYQAGEHERVWQDIRALGPIAGELRAQVLEVAQGTMCTVAQNADLIAGRLRALGWRPLYAQLRTPPEPGDAALFVQLEAEVGPIPPTLLAFWQEVGGINWVWDYNADETPPDLDLCLPLQEHDALCVHAPGDIPCSLDDWTYENRGREPELKEPLDLALAPDYLHKANISGGMPYGVELPFDGADPVFAWEQHQLPFLDYLRHALRWGGFPGFDRHAQHPGVQDFAARMTRDLLPF
jgi:hypothetical protein